MEVKEGENKGQVGRGMMTDHSMIVKLPHHSSA